MNAEQLLKELTIRFNTDPKRYEKQDYGVLIKLLNLLVTNQTNIDNISSLINGDIQFKLEDNNLRYTLNGEDWNDLGSVKGEDGITPTISISDDNYWVINGIKSTYSAIGTQGEPGRTPSITINNLGHWVIDNADTNISALGLCNIKLLSDSYYTENFEDDIVNSTLKDISQQNQLFIQQDNKYQVYIVRLYNNKSMYSRIYLFYRDDSTEQIKHLLFFDEQIISPSFNYYLDISEWLQNEIDNGFNTDIKLRIQEFIKEKCESINTFLQTSKQNNGLPIKHGDVLTVYFAKGSFPMIFQYKEDIWQLSDVVYNPNKL